MDKSLSGDGFVQEVVSPSLFIVYTFVRDVLNQIHLIYDLALFLTHNERYERVNRALFRAIIEVIGVLGGGKMDMWQSFTRVEFDRVFGHLVVHSITCPPLRKNP